MLLAPNQEGDIGELNGIIKKVNSILGKRSRIKTANGTLSQCKSAVWSLLKYRLSVVNCGVVLWSPLVAGVCLHPRHASKWPLWQKTTTLLSVFAEKYFQHFHYSDSELTHLCSILSSLYQSKCLSFCFVND